MTTIHKALEAALGALETVLGYTKNWPSSFAAHDCWKRDAAAAQSALTEGRKALAEHIPDAGKMVAALPVGELTDEQIKDVFQSLRSFRSYACTAPQIEFARAILAAARSQPASEQASVSGCKWHLDDEESGTWASHCGELWSFIDGGPAENRVTYCHHCGKKVSLAEAPEVKP